MHASDDLISRGVTRKITPCGETDITPLSSDLPVVGPGVARTWRFACSVFRVLGLILLLTPARWWSVSLLCVSGAH